MENNSIYEILRENLIKLRKSKKLTQAEFANIIGYSDKAVSKWETGMTIPSIDTIADIAKFYNVNLDDLCLHPINDEIQKKNENDLFIRKLFIALLSICVLWLVATAVFGYSTLYSSKPYWQIFIWACPITFLFCILFDKKWGQSKLNVVFTSLFIWTLLTSLYIQFLEQNFFILFIIGAPIQLIVLLVYSVKSEKVVNFISTKKKKYDDKAKEKKS